MKSLKNIIQALLGKVGYRLQSTYDSIVDVDMRFMEIYKRCKPFTLTTKERMYALYKATEYTIEAGIKGDFVECGVWRGGSVMVIAQTLLTLGVKNRKIWLFDTYTGMTELADEDYAFGVKDRDDYQKSDASLEEVKRNVLSTGYPSALFSFVKGRVEDTIPKTQPSIIALLRLDTDWYESTKHEMIHLYPLLSRGGVLIIDDYGAWAGAKKAVDDYIVQTPILLSRIDRDGRIGIKI